MARFDPPAPLLPSRKPKWLRARLAVTSRFGEVDDILSGESLRTVCREARCPNRAECWSAGTAAFLLLGSRCTRGCAFCAVERGDPGGALEPDEPVRVAEAAARMGLGHVVLTSVSRDDLPDGGAAVYAETIRTVRCRLPGASIEVLVPDYLGAALETVVSAAPDVFAHNVETVERLTPALRHPRFGYEKSLTVLREAKRLHPAMRTKSSLLLGLGETRSEIAGGLEDLRAAGVSFIALGQYLRPTASHAPVARYVEPAEFDGWAEEVRRMGFTHAEAGPFVRTSYRAAEAVERSRTCPDIP